MIISQVVEKIWHVTVRFVILMLTIFVRNHQLLMKNPRKFIQQQTNQMLSKSTERLGQFKQFLFAPNLITFVISVVVGNSFGSTIKALVNLVFGLFDFTRIWLFSTQHTLYYNRFTQPLSEFASSLLTTVLIATIVFFTIRFINETLIVDPVNKWGYNQAHADALHLQKQNEETIALQRKILAELEKLNQQENPK